MHTSNRIHDRKMSVLGLCTVLQSPIKPPAVLNNAPHIIPMIIHQLELLVEAYKSEFVTVSSLYDSMYMTGLTRHEWKTDKWIIEDTDR